MNTEKYCKECKYIKRRWIYKLMGGNWVLSRCSHPVVNANRLPFLINPKCIDNLGFCEIARCNICGKEGKYWAEKNRRTKK